ncbi:hypothetical protein ATI14_3901 [Pseudomonas tolaasii NCPPB 2192]|uniref:Uncharacterized protein n=1 Tax=Pseudomonas tolaasii NCPPB 2192 TaxID=564423 RepID=A0ABX4QJC1_PSETO|nr:hypothetical protein ATI14_3901 [Pseudomonas tolaasii NCPPB 2192]
MSNGIISLLAISATSGRAPNNCGSRFACDYGLLIVPTLCVVMPPGTLRVPPAPQVSSLVHATRSATGCIPTQSVGTIKRVPALKIPLVENIDRSHALRGNAAWDAPRPASPAGFKPCVCDAERHGLYSHAERGNNQPCTGFKNPACLIVPTLCVGMPPGTLRVPPAPQVSSLVYATRSVTGCIPTQSVGTINRVPALKIPLV